MDVRDFAKDPQRLLDQAAVARGWIQPGEHWTIDVACLGPDCRGFSVAALGRNWRLSKDAGYIMKTDTAKFSLELVLVSLQIVDQLKPRWWILENPRAILRKLGNRTGLAKSERVTVTYCQYGMPYQKPTDLWGRFPHAWRPRPVCKPSAPCHEAAPRGSKRGIQRIGSTVEAEGFEVKEAYRHPMRVSPLAGGSFKDSSYSKANQEALEARLSDDRPRHPESITTHRRADGSRAKGTTAAPGPLDKNGRPANRIFPGSHGKPLAASNRAAALRSVVPRQLAEEFRDACEHDATTPTAHKPRSITFW